VEKKKGKVGASFSERKEKGGAFATPLLRKKRRLEAACGRGKKKLGPVLTAGEERGIEKTSARLSVITTLEKKKKKKVGIYSRTSRSHASDGGGQKRELRTRAGAKGER